MSEIGHNSAGETADELRQLIERVERLVEERKGIADDIRDMFTEAKGRGYDPKVMRSILRIRKLDKDTYRDEQAILETYLTALGMA
jgi:uncharacterized protein (UPF0335 family)